MHEKQMHFHNCSITATYNDENDPGYSLSHYDWQCFMKRLRKSAQQEMNQEESVSRADRHKGKFRTDNAYELSYYMCGEYGERTSRPHFHACLFGIDFNDKVFHKTTDSGEQLYTSETLDNIWGKGYCAIGDVTFKSAAYIARYIMQKYDWGKGKEYEEILDPNLTGEIYLRKKPYNQMSRNPGLGQRWFNKFQSDAYPHGKVILPNNHKVNTPKYYDNKYKKVDQGAYEQLQYMRYLEQLAQVEHQTPERLAVQELVAEAKTKSLQRSYL